MKKRSKGVVILSVLGALVAIRVAAPYATEYYLNERLMADLGDYRGQVDDVDLAIWRGAFRVEGVRVEKTSGADQVDFLRLPRLEASVSRRALLNGTIRLKAVLERPEINFVDAENPEDRQSGKGINWQIFPEDMFKLSLERVEIQDGIAAFRNFTSEPPVNIQASNIDFVATNISNIDNKDGELVASAEVTADLFAESPLSAKAEFNPRDMRNFIFASDVEIKDLKRLNEFAKAYANLDFKKGHGQLTVELKADNGNLTGYLKPAFEDVEIVDWEQDVEQQGDHPLRVMWEGVTGFLSALFSNPKTDQIATRVDIKGELPEGADVDTWSAVFGIVRNAFAEAINTNFDHITPLDVPEAGAASSPTSEESE